MTKINLKGLVLDLNDGTQLNLDSVLDKPVLFVNVASKCGFTPQYEALEELHKHYEGQGLTVIGLPTNQFKQEFGTDAEIAEFCSLNYGVTFPITKLISVNGKNRHPLYAQLTKAKDSLGIAGPVLWNFEKFLWLPTGEVHRFRSVTSPNDSQITLKIAAAA